MKATFYNALGTPVLEVESVVEPSTNTDMPTPMYGNSIKLTSLVTGDVLLTSLEKQKLGQMLQQGIL